MSTSASMLAGLRTVRTALQSRWEQLAPRERFGLGALGLLLGVWLLWAVALQPSLQTLRDSSANRAQLAQQMQHIRALQAQAQSLQQHGTLTRQEALQRLRQLTQTADTGFQLNQNNNQVTIQVTAVPAAALANWLTQARLQAQALPIEVHLSRATQEGSATWDGRIVLRLSEHGPRH